MACGRLQVVCTEVRMLTVACRWCSGPTLNIEEEHAALHGERQYVQYRTVQYSNYRTVSTVRHLLHRVASMIHHQTFCATMLGRPRTDHGLRFRATISSSLHRLGSASGQSCSTSPLLRSSTHQVDVLHCFALASVQLSGLCNIPPPYLCVLFFPTRERGNASSSA
jgi:hypothetical protein